MPTLHTIFQQYRSLSQDQLQKGKLFVKMMAQFLRTDPQYANRLDTVWMWNECVKNVILAPGYVAGNAKA